MMISRISLYDIWFYMLQIKEMIFVTFKFDTRWTCWFLLYFANVISMEVENSN